MVAHFLISVTRFISRREAEELAAGDVIRAEVGRSPDQRPRQDAKPHRKAESSTRLQLVRRSVCRCWPPASSSSFVGSAIRPPQPKPNEMDFAALRPVAGGPHGPHQAARHAGPQLAAGADDQLRIRQDGRRQAHSRPCSGCWKSCRAPTNRWRCRSSASTAKKCAAIFDLPDRTGLCLRGERAAAARSASSKSRPPGRSQAAEGQAHRRAAASAGARRAAEALYHAACGPFRRRRPAADSERGANRRAIRDAHSAVHRRISQRDGSDSRRDDRDESPARDSHVARRRTTPSPKTPGSRIRWRMPRPSAANDSGRRRTKRRSSFNVDHQRLSQARRGGVQRAPWPNMSRISNDSTPPLWNETRVHQEAYFNHVAPFYRGA